MQEAANLHSLEVQKWLREQATYEERIAILEGELNIAQQAQEQLDEQKQENMILKETIDRLRFEIDELRAAAVNGGSVGSQSAAASVKGSVSKSLGAELLRSVKDGKWDMDSESETGSEEGRGDAGGDG